MSDQSGLTVDQPFAELLAVEARLASGELQACAENNNPAQPTVDEPTTYHRSSVTVPALHAWGDAWQWTYAERPLVPLAVGVRLEVRTTRTVSPRLVEP